VHLLDTDVLIDISRGHPEARAWIASLPSHPGVTGFAAMEFLAGARNKRELAVLQRQIALFAIYWPTAADCAAALALLPAARLRHGIGVIDMLIGSCAVGLGATLCTFNARHFRAIPGLTFERPYRK
jgi:predicted nucleic acid-binding protein